MTRLYQSNLRERADELTDKLLAMTELDPMQQSTIDQAIGWVKGAKDFMDWHEPSDIILKKIEDKFEELEEFTDG